MKPSRMDAEPAGVETGVQRRDQVLRFEMLALLHDFGKLGPEFLNYRRGWRRRRKGYYKDPHTHLIAHKASSLLWPFRPKVPINKRLFNTFAKVKCALGEETRATILQGVEGHEGGGAWWLNILRAADRLDSAIDRNNPLFGAEQTRPEMSLWGRLSGWLKGAKSAGRQYRGTVFGFEEEMVLENIQKAQAQLTDTFLEGNRLQNYLTRPCKSARRHLLEEIRKAYAQGCSDTTRPSNDTTLWDHSYAVATLAKAMMMECKLRGKRRESLQDVDFQILGVGWDGTAFLSASHRIADVGARYRLLENFQDEITDWIEFDLAIGNCVYRDLDGIYFLTSCEKCINDKLKPVADYESVIREKSFKFKGRTGEDQTLAGELCPNVEILASSVSTLTGYGDLTRIVECVRKLRKRSRGIPVTGNIVPLMGHLERSGIRGADLRKPLCPLCGLRPLEKAEGKWKGACQQCLKRRKGNAFRAMQDNQSPYFEELARGNRSKREGRLNRLALVMLHFDLDLWLDGTMFRTLFVKDLRCLNREIRELGAFKAFKKIECERRDELYRLDPNGPHLSFQDVENDFRSPQTPRAFLYGRRVQKGRLAVTFDAPHGKGKDPWILCTKTPTPSSLLDAWITTERFMRAVTAAPQAGEAPSGSWGTLAEILPELNRKSFQIPTGRGVEKGQIYEAAVIEAGKPKSSDGQFRFVCLGDRAYVLDEVDPSGLEIQFRPERDAGPFDRDLKIEGLESRSFRPLRTIASTPSLGYLILPARAVPDYLRFVQEQYNMHFGKVVGRLPLFTGAIFFDIGTPMHVVFDAARRMRPNPGSLDGSSQTGPYTTRVTEVDADQLSLRIDLVREEQETRVPIQSRLGDNKTRDWHHPYMILDSSSWKEASKKESYFEIDSRTDQKLAVCAFEDLGDLSIRIFPNLTDFEYLDGAARRYEIQPSRCGARPAGPLGIAHRPHLATLLLDQLRKVEKVLARTDRSPVHHLEELLYEKFQQWEPRQGELQPAPSPSFQNFAAGAIQRFCPDLATPSVGSLLDVLDLYLHILKRK
ncbi:MAG: hypothetical protein ACE5JX_18850 [Acidobacteriota bacterium]